MELLDSDVPMILLAFVCTTYQMQPFLDRLNGIAGLPGPTWSHLIIKNPSWSFHLFLSFLLLIRLHTCSPLLLYIDRIIPIHQYPSNLNHASGSWRNRRISCSASAFTSSGTRAIHGCVCEWGERNGSGWTHRIHRTCMYPVNPTRTHLAPGVASRPQSRPE